MNTSQQMNQSQMVDERILGAIRNCKRVGVYCKTNIQPVRTEILPLSRNGEHGLVDVKTSLSNLLTEKNIDLNTSKKIFSEYCSSNPTSWRALGSFHIEDIEKWQQLANLTGMVLDIFFDTSDGSGKKTYNPYQTIMPHPKIEIQKTDQLSD